MSVQREFTVISGLLADLIENLCLELDTIPDLSRDA
jgi:hypothetical protein